MGHIKIHEKGTEMHEKLEIVALMLTNRSPKGYTYRVGETYFDFGQDWKWTTIIAKKEGYETSSYQALNPREHEEIMFAETYDELKRIAESILADKYCPDKVRDYETA